MSDVQCKLWGKRHVQVRAKEWSENPVILGLQAACSKKGVKMEICQEHMVADGEIERSIKKDGLVERTRRCSKCAALFKTFEMTDDNLARQQGKHDLVMNEMRRELNYLNGVFETIRTIDEMVGEVKEEVRRQYEFGNENRGKDGA